MCSTFSGGKSNRTACFFFVSFRRYSKEKMDATERYPDKFNLRGKLPNFEN